MSDFEDIKRATGNVENSCACDVCKKMCQTAPCIGTPDDILRLINNGYIGRLKPSLYAVGIMFNEPGPIQFVAPHHLESGRCTFLTKDNLCEIHDIKPTEGKLVVHSTTGSYKTSANYLVSQTWLSQSNKSKIKKIFLALHKYETSRR